MKTMKEYLSTAEGVRQMWEKINELLDNFDFNKVVIAMEALDWHWTCTPEEAEMYEEQGCRAKTRMDGEEAYYYPQVPQLMKRAREVMTEAIESMPDDVTWWCCGGYGFRGEASICTDDERADYYGGEIANIDDFAHSVDLRLSFDIEESTTY